MANRSQWIHELPQHDVWEVPSAERESGAEWMAANIEVVELDEFAVPLPSRDFSIRVLSGGAFDYEDDYRLVGRFVDEINCDKLYASAFGVEDRAIFGCRYTPRMLQWLVQELVVSPSYVFSPYSDFIQISNESLRYSVFGIRPDRLSQFDEYFGGGDELFGKMAQAIDEGEIGFGEEGKEWARSFLLPLFDPR